MCGRYYIEDETSKEMKRILASIDQKLSREKQIKTGEIFPTNHVPVLTIKDGRMGPMIFKWGFSGFDNKKIIINARSESVMEKPLFRDSLIHHRCLIPASGFFEWSHDTNKTKYYFKKADCDLIYMAGIYKQYEDDFQFAIITTDANDSMKPVHNRMPLIIPNDKMEEWLSSLDTINLFLKSIPPLFDKKIVDTKSQKGKDTIIKNSNENNTRKDEYEQLQLDFKQ